MVSVLHNHPVWLPQTQTWMHNLIRALPGDLVSSHVVCERTANLDQFAVPNLHVLKDASPWRRYWDLGLRKTGMRRHLGFLVKCGRRCGAQIVHSHFGDVGWAALGAVRLLRTPHVVTFYGFDLSRLPVIDPRWRTRYAALFRQVDAVVCEGRHMARCIVALGCPAAKISIQHLGVPVDEIAYRPREWAGGPLRVLIAASFREKKGVPYAIEALARLQARVELEVTIIGDATPEARSQMEKERILAAIARHRWRSPIRMLGYQSHRVFLEEAYQHHVFLSPSVTAADGDTEGGAPVSLIEMAASGMLIVSTRHCDIPEVVESGRTGWLAEERDAEGLVQHLEWTVEHRAGWRQLLDAGRHKIEAEFNLHVQARNMAKLYGRIAALSCCEPKGAPLPARMLDA